MSQLYPGRRREAATDKTSRPTQAAQTIDAEIGAERKDVARCFSSADSLFNDDASKASRR
jgi:hypothetical protein